MSELRDFLGGSTTQFVRYTMIIAHLSVPPPPPHRFSSVKSQQRPIICSRGKMDDIGSVHKEGRRSWCLGDVTLTTYSQLMCSECCLPSYSRSKTSHSTIADGAKIARSNIISHLMSTSPPRPLMFMRKHSPQGLQGDISLRCLSVPLPFWPDVSLEFSAAEESAHHRPSLSSCICRAPMHALQ